MRGRATEGTVLMHRSAWAVLVAVCCTAQAQDAQPLELSGGVVHRTLAEHASGGGTLLTERGWLPQVRASAEWALPQGAAIAGSLAVTGGDIDYHGQTQAGTPLSTTTRQAELAADVLWRPFAPAEWGQAWLTGQGLVNRRSIESTPTAGGLDETSTAVLLGVRWASPSFAAAGWQTRVEADARVSAWHRLEVDYRGLLDASRFQGARKHQWALRLVGARTESPWGWELEGARLRQGVSDAVPVYRNSTLFGTVRQPALTIDDVTLRVSRRF
jgi:hypothetical protein